MKPIQNILRLVVLLTATFSFSAHATNGYQLIGVGAYQKSLGGAVTANPGSAMTAVSNPAGMARVGARADFSMEAFMPDRDVDFTANGGDVANSAVDIYGVPAIGWTAPTSGGSDVYFGGGMYGTSGMGVDYAPTTTMPNQDWDGYSNISFWQMAPGFAWNVNERYSVGVTLNIDYQSVAFKQRDSYRDINFDLGRGASGFGLGMGIGILYDVNDQLTLGFNYKSKQFFDPMEYQLAEGDISVKGDDFPAGTYKLDLDYPQQAAIGLAYRATRSLTVSTDIKWLNWSDTMDKLSVKGPGEAEFAMDPGWDDQIVYALGVAYDASERVTLRAGYNYAESPFGEDEVGNNLLLPAIVETHYTVGMNVALNNHWDLGWHYMLVPEKTLTGPNNTKISLSEQSMGFNIGYRF
ncbi:OmpP1/FadL family transporter [Thiohalophilus thiocyanatoxydans]|uniref:Long-chain fatty acid transport protein n=1 Tax=Thiohalophilus thiocyanatoxydans TaxID=381308 RepID=A0A4R8IN78_9GAMM|nr:outer membrane protein transport protein [Thiohalophilus thiocyanatoxydans]TDY00570.1 long-chain fatty acid transport protein [Thiohalophilus thiocyanatoxydans]